jgi:hypothetical protein
VHNLRVLEAVVASARGDGQAVRVQ